MCALDWLSARSATGARPPAHTHAWPPHTHTHTHRPCQTASPTGPRQPLGSVFTVHPSAHNRPDSHRPRTFATTPSAQHHVRAVRARVPVCVCVCVCVPTRACLWVDVDVVIITIIADCRLLAVRFTAASSRGAHPQSSAAAATNCCRHRPPPDTRRPVLICIGRCLVSLSTLPLSLARVSPSSCARRVIVFRLLDDNNKPNPRKLGTCIRVCVFGIYFPIAFGNQERERKR